MSNYLDENKKWLALMEGEWNRSYGYPKRRSSRGPLDYGRAERDSFKRDELEYELRHEKKDNYAVYINDRLWKIVADYERARRMVATLQRKGKKAHYKITRSPVSESHPSKDQLADRWNDLDGDHGDNPKVKPFIRKAEAAFKDGDLETAMDMIKAGEAAARSVKENRADDAFSATFEPDGGGNVFKKAWRFITGDWSWPAAMNKEAGIRTLQKKGFSDEEIKAIRTALHQAISDMIVKYGEEEKAKVDKYNFTGWMLNINSRLFQGGELSPEVQKQVQKYLKKSLGELAEAAKSLEEDFDDLDIPDDEWPDPLYDIKYAIETMQVPASALKDPKEMSKFIDNAYDWEMLDGPEYSPEELAPVLKKYYKELLAFLKKKDQGGMWESKDGVDQHPEVRKRYNAMLKTKPDSYERRLAVRAYTNKKKELRREKEEDKFDVAESMVSYGYDDMSNQETENAYYSNTKTKGDASVTVSANAKSMQDLHDILKLAGVELSDDHPSMQEPEAPEEPCDVCSGEEPMPSPTNLMGYSYETDKEKIADVIRDKLNQRLK